MRMMSLGLFLTVASVMGLVVFGFSRYGTALDVARPGAYTFDYQNPQINFDEVKSGGPAPEGIPALDAPKVNRVDEARRMKNDDQVIAIIVNGQARAYPLRILNWHEIVNDVLAGEKIAVVWCPLCGSAIVINRVINEETLDFGVSGLLYNSDVLMYDRQSRSLWSQLEMQSVSGKFSGVGMETLPVMMMDWEAFKKAYPNGSVLSFDTGHQRNYDTSPYAWYGQSRGLMFPVNHTDERLFAKTPVFGVRLTGKDGGKIAVALPVSEIVKNTPGQHSVDINNVRINLTFHHPAGKVEVRAPQQFEVDTAFAYWFAWAAFNPGTELVETLE